jgi:hypothetical protein
MDLAPDELDELDASTLDSLVQRRGVINVSFHAVLKGLRDVDIYM